mmetsp:Transcript_38410/g.115099  ORF Transcript_38410/g.115099 Transcript_38410/m.115099 type:complete len:298 (+) Transcript_38410:153-1046(+)
MISSSAPSDFYESSLLLRKQHPQLLHGPTQIIERLGVPHFFLRIGSPQHSDAHHAGRPRGPSVSGSVADVDACARIQIEFRRALKETGGGRLGGRDGIGPVDGPETIVQREHGIRRIVVAGSALLFIVSIVAGGSALAALGRFDRAVRLQHRVPVRRAGVGQRSQLHVPGQIPQNVLHPVVKAGGPPRYQRDVMLVELTPQFHPRILEVVVSRDESRVSSQPLRRGVDAVGVINVLVHVRVSQVVVAEYRHGRFVSQAPRIGEGAVHVEEYARCGGGEGRIGYDGARGGDGGGGGGR